MHPIERAVIDYYPSGHPHDRRRSIHKLDKVALGILELEQIGTQLVPKSYLSNTDTPASFEGAVKEPWKGFFHNFL